MDIDTSAAGLDEEMVLPVGTSIKSDVVDGVQFNILSNQLTSYLAGYDYDKSGWAIGNSKINIYPTDEGARMYPWDYELVFTNNPHKFTSKSSRYVSSMRDETGEAIPKDSTLLQQSLSFFMINKSIPLADGAFDTLDVVISDLNGNNQFDILEDKMLFGIRDQLNKWRLTIFTVKLEQEPQPNDVYFASYKRPFFIYDSLTYKVLPQGEVNKNQIQSNMDKIKVVPNPYVATNILFTNLPAQCEIKIFTISGVLVDELIVDNASDNGTAFWDLKSDEDLEVAGGMYIYHVKAKDTNAEKIGKFAIIK